jgi:hypothetical protein
MIDTPKEAATGDKAARDLMLSELLHECTKEDWRVSGASIYALDKSNGNNLFYANIQKESKHCSAYEILANAKLFALAPTIAAELIKERALNAKLLEVLKINQTFLKKVTPYKGQEDLLNDAMELTDLAIKQAEEL